MHWLVLHPGMHTSWSLHHIFQPSLLMLAWLGCDAIGFGCQNKLTASSSRVDFQMGAVMRSDGFVLRSVGQLVSRIGLISAALASLRTFVSWPTPSPVITKRRRD